MGSSQHPTKRQALRAIGLLFEPGDVIEIRALDVGRSASRSGATYSGYFNFDNEQAILGALRLLDGRAEGIYVILNRINPELLARANNRLQAKPKHTTSDPDIIERRWLYLDFDPCRPAGVSATDAEHNAALERAICVRDFLAGLGWPEPIYCDSGNGGHLLYRLPPLDLDRGTSLVKLCLQALATRFSDNLVKLDESTANAARLCKLYGTLARKGDFMPDRPHRIAQILDEPERLEPVPVECLDALAAEVTVAAAPSTGAKRNSSGPGDFDIDRWLENRDFEIIKGPETYSGGRRWTLLECPFNNEHKKPVIIELAGGALVYRCLHNSCADNDWKALRRLIEPDYREWARRPGGHPSSATDNPCAPGNSSETDAHLITDLAQIPSVWQIEASLQWRVEDMIAEGSVTLICAESGTGKTWVGYYIAGCVAWGISVLGHQVRPCKVLYLDGENPLYVVKQRLFDLGIAETPNLTVWGGWNLSPPVGPDHPLVIEFARKEQGLIIYDSLIEFHPGYEQSSTETRAFMRHFRKLAYLGATVIVLHHTGKSETSKQYRGSSDIKAAVDTAYLLERPTQQPEELRELSMNCFKARLAPGKDFGMRFQRGRGFVCSDAYRTTRTVSEIIVEILTTNPDCNQTRVLELGHSMGCSKCQIERCLKDGLWLRRQGPNNSILYNLPAETADAEAQG
jgi:hypothetical protein